MKDHEAVTLKAFLVALTTQSEPLTPDLQNQLHLLSENLLANLVKLDAIARQSSVLSAVYKSARQYFDAPSERNKGALNLVNDPPESSNTDNLLIDNITKYSESTNLEEILKKLRELDAEKALQMAKEGIATENPVQFFKDQFS
jgi:hypothetical protein